MIRLGRLAGLPVILEGASLGRVEQSVLSRDGHALAGLVVRRGLGAARWVASRDILVLGDVSVIVCRKPGKVPADAGFTLTGVKDSAGLNLGRVTDVFLHRRSLQVAALEITLGLVEEFTLGRLLARQYVVHPAPDEPGQVLIPCGAVLEKPPEQQ